MLALLGADSPLSIVDRIALFAARPSEGVVLKPGLRGRS